MVSVLELDLNAISDNLRFSTGKANWKGFQLPLADIFEASKAWKEICEGHNKLWLCWNVDPAWNFVQQKMAKELGWTPLVGGDPRAGKPTLVDGALEIDFNATFGLPMIHMVFAIEFAFLYAPEKLAFWHSDLLVRPHKLKKYAGMMNSLKAGDMLVTKPGRGIKQKIRGQQIRYWELLGCTTQSASAHQFEHGAGWMANIMYHPMTPQSPEEKVRRAKQYYDHGAGIHYWANHYKPKSSKITTISEGKLDEGHFSRIRAKNYQKTSPNNARRDLTSELSLNFDLTQEACKLGLERYL